MAGAPSLRIGLALTALLCACSSTPPPLELPPIALKIDYRPAPVHGGTAAPVAFALEVVTLAHAPPGRAVQLEARLIESESGRPFRGASRLAAGSRWLTGQPAVDWSAERPSLAAYEQQVRATAEAVVAPDLETIVRPASTPLPDLRLTIGGDELVVHLVVTAEGRSELITVAAPLQDEAAVLYVPRSGPGVAGHAVVLQRRGDAGADALAAAHAAAAKAVAVQAAEKQVPTAWRLARAAVGAQNRRPALLAIARPLGLDRIVDLMLIADESALVDITRALDDVPPDAPDVAWQVERATWTALLPRLERAELTAVMAACTRRQFGALADEPTALRLLLATSRDCPELGAAVHEENMFALADRDAVRRVHAHAWLREQQAAVPDYDPLAPADARKKALEAHEARARTPAAEEEK